MDTPVRMHWHGVHTLKHPDDMSWATPLLINIRALESNYCSNNLQTKCTLQCPDWNDVDGLGYYHLEKLTQPIFSGNYALSDKIQQVRNLNMV